MNLKQARYIKTIAQCGSITAAAKKLYVSQPSLSQMLRQIEEEIGLPLFDRSVSPFHITYAGEKYLEAAEIILMPVRSWKTSCGKFGTTTPAAFGWESASAGLCRCFRWYCRYFLNSTPM